MYIKQPTRKKIKNKNNAKIVQLYKEMILTSSLKGRGGNMKIIYTQISFHKDLHLQIIIAVPDYRYQCAYIYVYVCVSVCVCVYVFLGGCNGIFY